MKQTHDVAVEKGGFMSPDDIIRAVSKSLDLNLERDPAWGNKPPIQRMFTEEAPMLEQRILAQNCLNRLHSFSTIPSELPIAIEQIYHVYTNFHNEAKEGWSESAPFPSFTLTHLLGAVKRQMVWFAELKQFEETVEYDQITSDFANIQDALEQAVRAYGGTAEQVTREELSIVRNLEQEIFSSVLPDGSTHIEVYLADLSRKLFSQEADNALERALCYFIAGSMPTKVEQNRVNSITYPDQPLQLLETEVAELRPQGGDDVTHRLSFREPNHLNEEC